MTSILLIVGIVGFAACVVLLALAYRGICRPLLALHFCEDPESRRNCPARRRRKSFEGHCGRAFSCLWVAWMLGSVRDVMARLAPDGGGMILGFQGVLVAAAVFSVYAAVSLFARRVED